MGQLSAATIRSVWCIDRTADEKGPFRGAFFVLAARCGIDSLRSPFGPLRRLSPLRGSAELLTRGFQSGTPGTCLRAISKSCQYGGS